MRNVKEDIKFDGENGNTLYQDKIGKEMAHINDLQTIRTLERG